MGDQVDEGTALQQTLVTAPGSWGSGQSRAAADQQPHQPGVSHALRIRFGDLDESVELGELIGKGGEGPGSAVVLCVLCPFLSAWLETLVDHSL